MKFQVAALVVFVLVAGASAECCKRKGDFGCCGNGPCNIFCCNCDNGCNAQCEDTHCDTGEWFECAGVVSACAAACVVTEGEACADCMGPLYDTCKKCYSSSALGERCAAHLASRDAWFDDIADRSDCISFAAFDAYVHKAAAAGEAFAQALLRHKTTGAEFARIDADGSGCIDRDEFER